MNSVAPLFFALVCFVWIFHLGSCQGGGGGGGCGGGGGGGGGGAAQRSAAAAWGAAARGRIAHG